MLAPPRPAPPPASLLTAPHGNWGTERHLRRGTVLFEEGARGDCMFLVLSGQLRSYCSDERGRELTLALHGPGSAVGEMCLDARPHVSSCRVHVDAQCRILPRAGLLARWRQDPAVQDWLLQLMLTRAEHTTHVARTLALDDLYSRLRQLLMRADAADETRTHQCIAQHIGCSREMVSKLLKSLEQGGYVRRDAHGRYSCERPLPERW